jgi:hypothetical protein
MGLEVAVQKPTWRSANLLNLRNTKQWLVANVWPIFELLGGIPQSEMTCLVLSVDANCRELKLIDYSCPFGYIVCRRTPDCKLRAHFRMFFGEQSRSVAAGANLPWFVFARQVTDCLRAWNISFRATSRRCSTSICSMLLRRPQKIPTDWKWMLAHVCFRSVLNYIEVLNGNKYY